LEYRHFHQIEEESEDNGRKKRAATTHAGKGVIAIPPTASVEAIRRSAPDETRSQILGREDHK
jgi:hypothetical protein